MTMLPKATNDGATVSWARRMWQTLTTPHESVPQILPYERAKALAILSLFLLGCSVFMLLFADSMRGFINAFVLAGISGVSYGFARSKRPLLGSLILIVCILILYYVLWTLLPEFIVRSLIFLLIPIFLAVLLLPASATLWICLVSFIGLLTLPLISPIRLVEVGDLFFAILVSMILAVVLAYLRESDVEKLKQQQMALDEANTALEKRVVERTMRAEKAQREAEAARSAMAHVNHQLEKEIWIKTQQNELARAMRGDLDLQALSSIVIRHLCQTLDMPVGVLFAMNEGSLEYEAGYACTLSADHLTTFALEEGVIGQVAQRREPMHIHDISDSYLSISLGVATVSPNHIYIIPFLYEEAVMGVIEFGYLSPLPPRELLFLEQAMETIGTAFHAVYIREQMKALLQVQLEEEL